MTTNMRITRTDLALETVEDLRCGGDISRLDGVAVSEYTRRGYGVTDVRVTSPQGAASLGKPEGRYITVDLRPYFRREEQFFRRAVECLACELRALLPGTGEDYPVLVAGLGNRGMTADAVGPLALESLLVTRHMVRALPRQFRGFTPVSALAPGV
ncbi:MAG: GPR endopeptidase, partial [Vescimonas sp.]